MSNSDGPARRRRIAGESKPAAPTGKPTPPRIPARKAAAKKAAMQKAAPPATPPGKAVATAKAARTPKVAGPGPDQGADRGPGLDLRWLIPATLVAMAAIVAGVLLTVNGVQHVRGGGGDDLDSSREQAVSAAGTAVQTIFTYRYDKLDEHLSASTALMTKSYAKTFEKYQPALVELAPQRKVQLRSVTREAAVLPCGDECSADKLKVLVFYDQVRLLGNSKTPTVLSYRASVSMVKTDEGWLVDNVRAL